MKLYEEEKAMVGKTFETTKEQKISNCKMKVGDTLTVIDYGPGPFSNRIKFKNNRLPHYTFMAGTWLFKKITGGIK